jgi:hypothetical protein
LHASDTRGRFAVVAERGIGKSSLLWGLILFLKLTGRQNFPVCLPWSAQPMKRAFRFWRTALCFNKRLAADYPEFAAPFAHCRGIAQRLPSLVWSDTGLSCGALLQCGDGMIVMPDNRGVIGGSTINGNPKGLNYPQEDGTVLRPTLALIDDVQDRKTSKSADLIAETICKIDGDVAGLGEAGEDFAMLISGNCSAPRDVMAHYLADDGWQSVRIPCVEEWPTGFDDRASECRRRWEEWRQIFLHDESEALKFYSLHAPVMTAGMKLSAPSCYKITKTTPDPCYGAMRQYYKMGHEAFYAEKQQEPIDEGHATGPYTLTWEHVAMHYLPGRKFLELPAAAKTVVLASDLNEYGIHSVCAGFGNDLTGWIPWYNRMDNDGHGIVDPGIPEPEAKKQMFEALVQMGKQVAALAVATEGGSTLSRPSLWLIDAGYMGDVVRRFIEGPGRTIGVQVMAARGFNASKYRPYGVQLIGKPREQCHLTESAIVGRFIGFNADYWREVSQKAWLSSPDAPGSLSLYQPGPAHHHRDFAEQVTRERLIDKSPHKITGQPEWTWATMPGRHDYGDALTMCFVAAAWGGIGTGGDTKPVAKAPARVLVYRPSGGMNRR